MTPPFIFFWSRPTPPLFLGGAEITQRDLAVQLSCRGREVLYVGSLEDPNFPTMEREENYKRILLSDPKVKNLKNSHNRVSYEYEGIKCLACPQKDLPSVLDGICRKYPRAYFISSLEYSQEFIRKANRHRFATIGWLHSADHGGLSPLGGEPGLLISTSHYIAALVERSFGLASTVFYPPFMAAEDCFKIKEFFTPLRITYINPVPEKGCDLFVQIAECLSERKFLVVEGWYKNHDFLNKIPSNAEYLSPQKDMQVVWSNSDLLLVPSQVDEAFGRVVVEASIRGIPCIASNKGGLAEALNGSGSLVGYNNLSGWVSTIRHYDNPVFYLQAQERSRLAGRKFLRDPVAEFLGIIGPP